MKAEAKAIAGIADHCGWAVVVCVADGEVIDRRRIELIAPGLPAMPHHHDAQGLPEEEAVALTIRKRPPLPPTIAERIANYHAQTRADGIMYRDALAEAAQALGWSVKEYGARTVFVQAAEALGLDDISPRLRQIGNRLGPPWRKDHQLAAAAAMAFGPA